MLLSYKFQTVYFIDFSLHGYLFYLEGYHAFLDAHTTMNKIQLYMRQIPQHMETMSKIVSSKASANIVSRMLRTSVDNIERIGKTCVTLAREAEDSFTPVINLLGEVIKMKNITDDEHKDDVDNDEIELNSRRRQLSEEVRQTVRKAQEEYCRALKNIPNGFKASAIDLGRAVAKVLNTFRQAYALESFATDQIIHLVSSFGQSLNSLIQILSKTEHNQELQAYKIIFESYNYMINISAQNNLTTQAIKLIERAITLVDLAIKYPNASIKDQLESLADDVKPFIAAEELSSSNNAPISVSSGSELLKIRLAQERLSQTEHRFNICYTNHAVAMKQMRVLTSKFAGLSLKNISIEKIMEMLEQIMKLFIEHKKNWNDLVLSFSSFSDRVSTGFGEKLKLFVDTPSFSLDSEESATDRKVMFEFIIDGSDGLYHESYVLFILSRTYYDVSKKYLMPRVAGLSLMLASSNNNERRKLLAQLRRDTKEVQTKIKELLNERKEMFEKAISKKRAEINEVINNQGADGNEMHIIKQGEKLLGRK